jgi:hypothetical protein
MTSYISIDNQTMLWYTIQKIQLLHEKIPTNQQQEWFKNILGIFYQQNMNVNYDLRQLNKNTISYMINLLKQNTEKQESYTRQFVDRQQDYDKMIKKDLPPEPNFKEPLGDGVIENMEELLQQQLKQRELDVHTPFPIENNIRKEVDELQKIVKSLQDEIAQIKKSLVTEPKEIS